MHTFKSILKSEDGSAILLSIMILVVVSVIGVEASRTSSIEVQIAGAERDAKENFYRAECAAMEVAQRVENAISDDLKNRSDVWLNSNNTDMELEANWDYDDGGTPDTAEQSVCDPDAYYGAMDRGISSGSSLDMSQISRLHSFRVFGRYVAPTQGAFIEMGYRKRF